MTEPQILTGVELPLALPVLVGGFRIALLQVIATATIGAFLAGGGLGRYIIDGIARRDEGMLYGGVLLVAVLAVGTDLALTWAQRRLTPRGCPRRHRVKPREPATRRLDRHLQRPRPAVPCRDRSRGLGLDATAVAEGASGQLATREVPMRNHRRLALGASILASMAIVGTAGGGAIVSAQEQPTVRIGSDGFYELQLMAEIYGQALEAAGFSVDRQLGIGTREARVDAFDAAQVDLVPEYVGSGLGFYTVGAENPDLAALEVTGDGETNRANLQKALDIAGVDATVLGMTAGEDTNAVVVRPETAQELGLCDHQRSGRCGRPAVLRSATGV